MCFFKESLSNGDWGVIDLGGEGGGMGDILSYFGQVISVSNYSQDEASVWLPELHDASSHFDGPHQVSFHGVEHSILQRLSPSFGSLPLVLKAL